VDDLSLVRDHTVLSVVVGSRAYGLAAPACLTRQHAHHHLGSARRQWALFERSGELKPLLHTFRVPATGIHLMRAGSVVADLTGLCRLGYGPAYLPERPSAGPTLHDLVVRARLGCPVRVGQPHVNSRS
jgi:predicted nucleotidyltransferase